MRSTARRGKAHTHSERKFAQAPAIISRISKRICAMPCDAIDTLEFSKIAAAAPGSQCVPAKSTAAPEKLSTASSSKNYRQLLSVSFTFRVSSAQYRHFSAKCTSLHHLWKKNMSKLTWNRHERSENLRTHIERQFSPRVCRICDMQKRGVHVKRPPPCDILLVLPITWIGPSDHCRSRPAKRPGFWAPQGGPHHYDQSNARHRHVALTVDKFVTSLMICPLIGLPLLRSLVHALPILRSLVHITFPVEKFSARHLPNWEV